MTEHLFACIMAGGTGSRFWPESTVQRPKQLLRIGTDKPLLELTMDRIASLIPKTRQLIVTGDAIVDAVTEAACDLPEGNVLSEPLRRNTAPCILLAAKKIQSLDPDGVMCVLPSDHLIGRLDEFLSILQCAGDLAARQDVLITLGIQADYPETGYGYIEFGAPAGKSGDRSYHRVRAFHEKPDLEKAETFLASGRFYWNSGMFVWSVRSIIKAIETYLPALSEAFETLNNLDDPQALKEQIDRIYPRIEGISIDYGIMEKAENIFGFAADIGWNDVGSWSSLEALLSPDQNGNVSQGSFVPLESERCIVSSHSGVTVAIGVKDLIIVHTPRATLVCDKSRAQQIKQIFSLLEQNGLKEYL